MHFEYKKKVRMNAANKIIVALDLPEAEALELARRLVGLASWLKVGITLYYSAGPAIVGKSKQLGFKVFCRPARNNEVIQRKNRRNQ